MASSSPMTLEIDLLKTTKVYHQNDQISGLIVIKNLANCKHDGITLQVEGNVIIQPNPKSASFLDSFYSNSTTKTLSLLNHPFDIVEGGQLPSGRTEIPFELPLEALNPRETLFETYHGVFITIQYMMRCTIKRSLLSKDILESVEFYIEYEDKQADPRAPVHFDIRPQPMKFVLNHESLEALDKSITATKREIVPKFQISGQLDSYVCKISEPFTGEITIDYCDARIRSIELQLVRVETCGNLVGSSKDNFKDATEVQNIQIGEGDVERGIVIPIYMIFPRFFTCPTLRNDNFRIEFEVNLVLIFEDNHLVTENFPIRLIRSISFAMIVPIYGITTERLHRTMGVHQISDITPRRRSIK